MPNRDNIAQESAHEPSRQEVRGTILNLVWPATVESLLQMGVGLVNTAIVGHLSAVAISAVGLCNRAAMLLAWPLYQAVSTGATVLVAQSVGAGNRERARTHAAQAILFGVFSVALVAIILSMAAVPALQAFNPEPDVLRTSISYLRLLVIGLPAVGVMMSAGAALRGAGDTRSPMVVAVLVNVINVVVSWVLIYGNLGFPAMGVVGSAISTILAQWIGAFLSLWALASNSILEIRLRESWRLDRESLIQVLRIGLPASGESFAWQVASMILTFNVTSFGTEAFAAHQIGSSAESLSYMPTAGFEIASTALVGQAIGASNTYMARRYSRELTIMSAVLTFFTAGVLFCFPHAILGLLVSDPEVVSLAAIYLRIMAAVQIPQQVSAIMKGAMRGSGDTRAPMYIECIGLWGIRLPAAYFLGFTLKMGIVGTWLSMTLDLVVRFVLTVWRYTRIPWVRSSSHQSQSQRWAL